MVRVLSSSLLVLPVFLSSPEFSPSSLLPVFYLQFVIPQKLQKKQEILVLQEFPATE